MSNEIENFELESMEVYAELLLVLQRGLMVHNKLVDAAFTLSFSNQKQTDEYLRAFRHFMDGVKSTIDGLECYVDSQSVRWGCDGTD